MTRLILLASNGLRGILYARTVYLWVLAAFLIAIRLLPLILIPNPAVPSGLSPALQERLAELIRNRRPNTLANGFNDWSLLCIVFGILAGATALSTEIRAKTIITTLARPVRRWELLAGKWVAIQAFSLASLAIGLVFFQVAAAYFAVTFSSAVWMAIAHAFVATMLYSAMTIAFATVLSPALSGALAVILAFLPGLVGFLLADVNRFRHAAGTVLDYIVPPGYSNLYTLAIRGATMDFSAQARTLGENTIYCAVFLVAACLIFSKREVTLG